MFRSPLYFSFFQLPRDRWRSCVTPLAFIAPLAPGRPLPTRSGSFWLAAWQEKAHLCRMAEHNFLDMPCGIMDQFVTSMAVPGAAQCGAGRPRRLVLFNNAGGS